MVTGEWRGEAGARVYSGIALVVEDQSSIHARNLGAHSFRREKWDSVYDCGGGKKRRPDTHGEQATRGAQLGAYSRRERPEELNTRP